MRDKKDYHYFLNLAKRIEKEMKRFLPLNAYPKLSKALRYSLFSGGKRIRPVLVILGNKICGGKITEAIPLACAVEFIHTYSLIHDDLPVMDNDDYRRGKPSCHKRFNEPFAILAGDGLLTHAFQILSGIRKEPETVLKIIRVIAQAAGPEGMVSGQAADIDSSKKKNIDYIHLHKTAKLIQASLVSGGILAKGKKKEIDTLSSFGKKLGILFQLTDDLLDFGRKKELSYPQVFGVEKTKQKVERLLAGAKSDLAAFGKRAKLLIKLTDIIAMRKK